MFMAFMWLCVCIAGGVAAGSVEFMQTTLTAAATDTDTTLYYDAAIGKYVLYTRMFRHERRWVGRAESDDLFHWTGIEPIIWPRLDDPPDRDFYQNAHTEYPDLPQYRLMFPMVWFRFTERSEVLQTGSVDQDHDISVERRVHGYRLTESLQYTLRRDAEVFADACPRFCPELLQSTRERKRAADRIGVSVVVTQD